MNALLLCILSLGIGLFWGGVLTLFFGTVVMVIGLIILVAVMIHNMYNQQEEKK